MYKTLNLSTKIKMIVSDFDGIFTDNSVYVLDENTRIKKLSYKDIMGVSIAIKNGINVAIISGEKSKQVEYIANKFNLTEIHQGIRIKLPVLQEIKEKYNLSNDEVIYVGDDIIDIDCLKNVGYPITVDEANYKVKQLENIQITHAKGGNGAFREIVDNLIELKEHEKNNRN